MIGTDAEREAQISALLAADPDLVYNAETGKFYQVDSGWYEPAEARTNAESNLLNGVNGQLVTIRNAAENEFVWDLVKSLGARTWIGATDATVEGEWRWIESGSEADQFWSGLEDGYAVNGAYQNWASGSQPNQSGEEDWAQMDNATGEWWDNKADTVHHFVTEWYADDVLDVTDPLNYAITAGNTDGAFAIDASTGQITVANSAALDFETTPSFTLTVAAIDREGAYDTATITVNLNDLFENTAPTLDSSGDMALTTITEDQTTNSGNTVAQIIASAGGDRIADPDAGAVEGIAVTGLNSGNGTWQYSINGGGTWLDVDAISDSSALLLRATDKLRFVPDALNADSASVDFRAWDQTEGSAGSKVDASSNGGATAFSSATETASIAVTAVNDAPGMPGVSLGSVNEDGSKTWLVTDFVSGSWDVDDGALKGLAIVGADNSNGTWQYTLDGTNWFDVGSVATDNALLLAADATSSFRFTPDSDWNGTTGMLQYKAWDQTSGTAGTYVDASVSGGTTAFSGTSGSVLTVNAVNDAPVVNLDPNNTSGGADDGDYNATFTEGDAPVAIAAADAILSDVDDTSITALNININSMVPDGAAERVTIGGHQFTYGNAEYVVVAVGGTSFAIDYDGAESFGVTKDGVGEMPIADAEALLLSLTYENVSQDPTAGERVFDIVISDGALGASATSTISVVPVNDAPVITSDGGAATAGVTVAENQTTVTTVTASDVDVGDTPTFSITGGADAAKFSIDPNTGALTFDNAPDYENPGDVGADNVYEVEVTADDGNGGTDVQTISITVANTSDNMPVANADAYSVDEDGSLTVDWWDSDWSHRQELTFDNLAQSETLTDFPVLVVLNSGNIDYALTKDDGSDLRFFAADGTPLAYQIEQWNEAGDSSVWVRVPQITGGSSNDSITMYYGNAAANPVSDVAGVWDSDFVGVWHLNEEQAGAGNSGTYKDATGQGHDGIDRVAATGQEGQVTDGQQFGANDWIEIDHDPSLDLKDSMTISFWIKPTSDSGTFNRVVEKGLWGFNDSYYFGGGNGTNDLTFYLNGQGVIDTPDDVLTVGVWQHAAVSYTSNGDGTGTARLYLDGVEIATGNYTNGTVAGNTGRLAIGHPDASYDFDGFIDEVQISKTDRSADWIAAQYQATKNAFGSEFVQFGAAEVAPAIDGVITNDTDADGDLLAASLVSGPSNAASFSFNKDGTFSYAPNADFAGTDTFTYKVNDGTVDGNTQTVTITVNPVNDAPVRTAGTVANLTVAEDAGLTSLGLGGVTYSPGGGADESGQTLSYDVTVIPSVSSGDVFLADGTTRVATGSYSITDIRGMQFKPADDWSGTTAFEFKVTDSGGADSGSQFILITVDAVNDAPVVDLNGTNDAGTDFAATFTEGGGAVLVADTDAILGDVDSATFNSLSVNFLVASDGASEKLTIAGYTFSHGVGDVVTRTVGSTTFEIDCDGTGFSIALAGGGVVPLADLQALIRGISYENTALDPTSGDRTIEFVAVDDSGLAGPAASSIVTVVPVNDGPTATIVASGFGVNEDDGYRLLGGISVSDPDAGSNELAVTLSVNSGLIRLGNTAGLTFTVGGNDSAGMTFTGTLADLNTALGTFTYRPDPDFSGTDTLTLSVDDQGNTGGGALSHTDTANIVVSPVNDVPVFAGADTGAVTEDVDPDVDGWLETAGTLTIADPDSGESSFQAGTVVGAYGSLTIDAAGNWAYAADNTQAAIQQLDVSETLTDILTVTSFDGTTHDIVITINGAEDAPVISGTTIGAVTEGNVGDAPVTATGSLSISDVDSSDTPAFNDVASTVGDNAYGSFTLTSGTWTYTLDQSAVQDLDAGDVVNDTITYTATDGSTQQITVSITGTDDSSVITGTATGAVLEGNVGDAPVTATGSISISDVDADDSPVFNDVANTVGDNSYGSFQLVSGTWTYTLDQSAVQDLDAGDVVNDTITYTATDGSTQQITVSITGTDDSSVITGTVAGAVLEGNVGDAPVTATGSIGDL